MTSRLREVLALPRRVIDVLFGYDFFISYAHADGAEYPRELDRRLRERRYDIHLDSRDFHAGSDLTLLTRIRVQNSRILVVVGREAAARESYWVRREFEIFQAAGRDPVVLDVDGAVEAALADPPVGSLAELIADQRQIMDDGRVVDRFLRERDDAGAGGTPRLPNPALVERLEARFEGDRVAVRRMRWLVSAVAVLAVSTVTAIAGAVLAVENGRQAALQRDLALGRLVAADAREAANEPNSTVGHLDRALLLAALSHRLTPGPDAATALLSALDMPMGLAGYLHHEGGPRLASVAFTADGTAVTSAEDGTLARHPMPVGSGPPAVTHIDIPSVHSVVRRDIDPLVHAFGGMAGELVFCVADRCVPGERPTTPLDAEVTGLAISADGRRFASGFANGTLLVHRWDDDAGRANSTTSSRRRRFRSTASLLT